jgi:hypothetical protein
LVKNFRPNLQLALITALRRKRGVFGRDGDVIVDGIGVVGRTQKIAQLHIQPFQKKTELGGNSVRVRTARVSKL